MSLSSKRILLEKGITKYYLLNIQQKSSDGSLYIEMPREGTNTDYHLINDTLDVSRVNLERPKTKALSYHSSGFIHFKNLDARGIYADPIFEITKPFAFFHASIPGIKSLDKFTKPERENDVIIKSPPYLQDRFDLGLIISPNNWELNRIHGFGITYKGLFDLVVSFNDVVINPPQQLERCFIYAVPPKGLYDKPKYSKDYSQILYHQVLAKQQNVIIYKPNNEGVYRMFFAVPMRIPPRIKITFKEPGLEAVIIDDETRTCASARFKVKGKQGFIKEAKDITYLELDAEL